MASNFDILYDAIMRGDSTSEEFLNEDAVSRISDWADAVQSGWRYLSSKLGFEPDKRAVKIAAIEKGEPPAREKESEAMAEREIDKLSGFLHSFDLNRLTDEDARRIAVAAQNTLDQMSSYLGEEEIPALKTRVDDVVGRYVSNERSWRKMHPEDVPVKIPATSAAAARLSRPPPESDLTKLESVKQAVSRAKDVIGLKYDSGGRRIPLGNKLMMLMLIFGITKNITFD